MERKVALADRDVIPAELRLLLMFRGVCHRTYGDGDGASRREARRRVDTRAGPWRDEDHHHHNHDVELQRVRGVVASSSVRRSGWCWSAYCPKTGGTTDVAGNHGSPRMREIGYLW